MTDPAKTPWLRVRDARGILEWHIHTLTQRCGLAITIAPKDIYADREALADFVNQEMRILSAYMIEQLEAQWETEWEKRMAGKFVDLPSLQN
jgi:hypothetical protein